MTRSEEPMSSIGQVIKFAVRQALSLPDLHWALVVKWVRQEAMFNRFLPATPDPVYLRALSRRATREATRRRRLGMPLIQTVHGFS